MAAASTNPITELDFDVLKEQIIAYIKTNPTFTDYNFEGSALNAIADVLAYNTHYAAYYANMLHSESFLDTAQKRTSVVSKAKELGYTPRSVSGSKAFLYAVLTDVVSTSPTVILRGSLFSGANENGTHQFVVTKDTVASVDGTTHTLMDIPVCEGLYASNVLKVDSSVNPSGIYSIPNKNVDISTLRVFVRDNISATIRTEYYPSTDVFEAKTDSKVYYIQESFDGYFQIYFGGDLIGAQPVSGNVIDIDYVIPQSNALGNGCKLFNSSTNFGTLTPTSSASFGGADRESLDSIRRNALPSNMAKGRAVTASDYGSVLKEKFDFIKSTSVWGGEDNTPPVYGKVFVSVQPYSGFTITDSVKNDVLLPVLKKYSVATVIPVIVDPVYMFINMNVRVKFSRNKTLWTAEQVETNIKNLLVNYFDSESMFGFDYLESTLTRQILEIDPGVMSVELSKKVMARLRQTNNVLTKHELTIGNEIKPGSITSSKFNIISNDRLYTVQIKDSITTTVNSSLDVVNTLYLYDSLGNKIESCGTINYTKGTIELIYSVNSHVSNAVNTVSIYAELVSRDILSTKNKILVLDDSTSVPEASILPGMTFVLESYEK